MGIIAFLSKKINSANYKKIKAAEESKSRDELVKELEEIKIRLEAIRDSYNHVSDDDLIEALIFEEKGLKARLSHIIKYAKENNIKAVL